MEPASAESANSSASNLKKWGPIGAIALVVAAVVGIVVVSGGDDDEGADTATTEVSTSATEPTTTEASDDTMPDATEPTSSEPATATGGEVTYPLSFSQAEEQGIEVAWDDRCDTETGRIALPWYFAPECYAPFEGDNGGATATGVTADSIKVVYYQGPDDDPVINYLTDAISVDDTNVDQEQTARDYLEMFQSYYEFYGRTIDLETYVSTGITSDEVTARADAVRIAEEIQPFAVLGGPTLTNAFADELAARDILCIGCTPGQPPEWFAERDPYVWSLAISASQARAQTREFLQKQVIGGNAVHAGDESFQSQPRKFGMVYIASSPESEAINQEFAEQLRADGADIVETLAYQLDPGTIQSQASQIIAKLKAAGVNSVLTLADPIAPRDFTREATAQEYFPEWILAVPAGTDVTAFARTYDQEQWSHAFGVSYGAARVLPEISGYYALYEWWKGAEAPAADSLGTLMPNFSLFYAVTMYAGPNLTHESWRDALMNNQGTRPAISQPSLSYGDKDIWDGTDYNGVDDATMVWWDSSATGPDEIRKDGTGMYMYVDGGTRYLPGEWPSEDRMFDPDGAVAIYDAPPPGEEVPAYPSPAG